MIAWTMDCTQLFVLLLLVCCSERANAQGVQLMLQGAPVANHGFVLRGDIGEAVEDTVMCVTDDTDCCTSDETGNGAFGSWIFPNGSNVQGEGAGTQFYRSRGPQVVRLHRRRGGPPGIYRCSIPDASGGDQDLYVGLYTTSSGQPDITSIQFTLTSELNAQTPTFTLTCISEDGPVERVDWFRATTGGTALPDGSTFDISGPTVVNTESAEYHHPLTVTGRLPDTYTCRVISTRPVSAGGLHIDTMDIDIVAADPPTIVSAEQVDPESTTVRVTWTPPTGGATVTGYRIYYTPGGFRDVGDGGTTEDTFALQEGTYTITMVALSQHLPSTESNSVTVTVTVVTVVAPVITSVQPASPTSIMVVWTQQGEVDSFVIAYERVTGDMQQGPCPSVEDSGTVTVSDGTARQQTVMELEEFSTYSFTITAMADGGMSPPSESMMTTTEQAAPSGAPESVGPMAVTSTSITVEWDPVNCIDRNSEITQYTVRYGPESMPDDRETVTVPETGDDDVGMYTISPLTPFTSYSIQVAAVNNGGQSGEFSNAIIVETEQDAYVPSRVRDLQATPDLISIAVSWSEPETPNGIITAYEVYYQQQGEQEREFRNITDTSMTSTELTALRPETTYTISVRARTIAGPGEEVSIDRTTTSISRVVDLVATPGIVSIAVSWSTSGGSFEDITAYEVYYQQQGEQERELRNITDTSMTSTELTGLRSNTTYTISVRVYSIAGPGEEASTMATTTSIPAVQNVRVTSLSDTEVVVTWDIIAGVSRYIVFYSPVGNVRRQVPTEEEMVEVNVPPAMIGNLTTGVEYQFRVAAVVEVDGETFTGTRSMLDDSSRVVAGSIESSGEEESCAAAIAGSVVASVVLTALLYTVILVLVVVVLKRRQSTYGINRTALQKPESSTDIPLKECPAYGEFSVATPASATDEERVYEQPQ